MFCGVAGCADARSPNLGYNMGPGLLWSLQLTIAARQQTSRFPAGLPLIDPNLQNTNNAHPNASTDPSRTVGNCVQESNVALFAVPPTRPFTQAVQYIGLSFWVSIFPVVSTLIAPILLIRLPQGQELLNTVTDDQLFPFHGRWDEPLHNGLLYFALIAWALANWWGSRPYSCSATSWLPRSVSACLIFSITGTSGSSVF